MRSKGLEGHVILVLGNRPGRWLEKKWLRLFEHEMAT